MTPELEAAIEKVINFLEEQPVAFSKWDMADFNAIIHDIREFGVGKTGFPQYDLDYLDTAVQDNYWQHKVPVDVKDALLLLLKNA